MVCHECNPGLAAFAARRLCSTMLSKEPLNLDTLWMKSYYVKINQTDAAMHFAESDNLRKLAICCYRCMSLRTRCVVSLYTSLHCNHCERKLADIYDMQQSICSTSDSLRLNHNMSSKHPRFPVQRSLLVICTRQQTYLQQGMLVTHIHTVSQSCKLPHNSAWSYTRRMHISSRNTPTYLRVLSQSLYSEKASHFNRLSIKSAVAVVVYA